MAGPTAAVPGDTCAFSQTSKHPRDRRDETGEGIGRDTMRRHIEAEGRHAPGIVSDALKGKTEGRALHVEHSEIG